jgi:hypothetical protein
MKEPNICAGVWVDKTEMEVVLALRDTKTNVEVKIGTGPKKTRELIALLESACKQLEVPEYHCACGRVEEPCPGPDGKLGCER